jgi:hypothetical protein
VSVFSEMLGLEPSVESVQLEKADLENFITRKQRKIRATAPQLRLRHTTRLVLLRCEGCQPKRSFPLLSIKLLLVRDTNSSSCSLTFFSSAIN